MENSSALLQIGLSFALLWGVVSPVLAADLSLQCNGRRFSGAAAYARTTPDFEKRCYAIATELLVEATGNDHNLTQAEGIFETLLRFYPGSAYPLMGYAELEMRKRELRITAQNTYQIRQQAEGATRTKPVVPQSYATLGRAELLAGCLPCAEKAAATAAGLGVAGPELAVLRSLISELGGDRQRARDWLSDALAAPDLSGQARLRLHTALSAHYLRTGAVADAEREIERAIAVAPGNVAFRVQRAEFFLFILGNAPRAAAAVREADAITATLASKRVSALAEYLAWANEYIAGRPGDQIKRIAQISIVSPDEAFVVSARYVALSNVCDALLRSGTVRGIEVRDGDGNTALIAAAIGGNGKLAHTLIARHAQINAQNLNAERALSWFIRHRDRETVVTLLNAGGETEFADNDGHTPLLLAVQNRDAGMVTELLKRKARMSSSVPPGHLLAVAASGDDVETIQALLDGGVKVDAPDRNGQTALVTAVVWSRRTAAKLLLDRGADPAPAVQAARQTGNSEMLNFLRVAGRQRT